MVDICKLLISEGADIYITDCYNRYETIAYLTLFITVLLYIANRPSAPPSNVQHYLQGFRHLVQGKYMKTSFAC